MTKKQTLPKDFDTTIANLGKSPELAFLTNAPKPKKATTQKPTGGKGNSLQEALNMASAEHAKRDIVRGAFVMDRELYQQAKALAKRHNLSFNALAITLLKLALEKEGK